MSLPLALADTLRSGLNTIEDLIIPRQLALFTGTVNAMADYGTAACRYGKSRLSGVHPRPTGKERERNRYGAALFQKGYRGMLSV